MQQTGRSGRNDSSDAELSLSAQKAAEKAAGDVLSQADSNGKLDKTSKEEAQKAGEKAAKDKVKEAGEEAQQPASNQVTVAQGDTVWGALRSAGYSDQEIASQGLVNQVAQASGLDNADRIRPGDVLTLPQKEQNGNASSGRQLTADDIGNNAQLREAAQAAAAEAGLPADAIPGVGSTAQSQVVAGTNDMRQGTLTLRDPNTGEVLGSYEFNNGGFGKGSIPEGTYEVSDGRRRSDTSAMMVDGYGYSFVLTQQGMAPGTADDPRYSADRDLLRIHPDGNNPGTLGCIGILGGASVQRDFYENAQRLIEANGGAFTLEFS